MPKEASFEVANNSAAAVSTTLAFALPTWTPAKVPDRAEPSGSATTTTTQPPLLCPWKDVRFSASMKAKSFKPGQPVVLSSIVTNHGKATCSVVIGFDHGCDPTQVVVAHSGKFVWDACDLNNKVGARSNLWVLKDLRSGASYALTSTWHQKWGQHAGKPVQVPAGAYDFVSLYTDLINSVLYNASASVAFTIS